MIGPRHVLTAAHCFFSRNGTDLGMNYYDVIVGEHTLSDDTDGMVKTVCSRSLHPDWNGATTEYDFAILGLSEDAGIGERVLPVCLPSADLGGSVLDDKTMTVSGWGATTADASGSTDVLLKVDVPGISNAVCQEKYADYGENAITDSMMCAANLDSGGVDACPGDSGGMLYVTSIDINFYILI